MRRPRRSQDPAIKQSSSIAWRVALVFLACGALWVLVTDLLVYRLVDDPVVIGRLETAKGWSFVLLTVAVIYLVTDRSVRRLARSNATLKAVVTSISDGVLVLDRTGAITQANPAAAKMLGVEPEALVGMNGPEFSRRFHVARADGHLLTHDRFVSQRALTGEKPPPYKAVLHPPGRSELVTIVTGAPVRPVPGGPVELAVSVLHDVTDIQQLERMRDAFVSSAAHTLKTPVAVINAHAELLASGKTPSWRKSTDAIMRQSGRIQRLTENLLVLARIRSESLRLEPETLDLANVIDDAASEMEAAVPDHKLRANVRTHPIVFGDRQRLTLVVRNLIEVAYRRSVPHTDVALQLDENHAQARVSVAYRPIASYEQFAEWDADAGFAGLGLERYVSAELVSASKGMFGSETIAEDLRTDWVQIPTIIEEVPHA